MSDPGCFFHGEEPTPPEWFRWCYECGHYFLTEDEFLAAQRPDLVAPRADLEFCPLCLHDF